MPPSPTRTDRIRALPPTVFDEMFSDDDYEQTHALAERYKLNKEQEEALANTLSDVFLKDVALEKLPAAFSERLKISEDAAKKIAVDIAGWRLLHLKDYFGDVTGAIINWGGNPTNFLSVRAFDENAAGVLAEEIAKKLNLSFSQEAMQKLAAMVGSRVRGIRDDSEFKEALARPREKGGIAADAETAQKILDEVLGFLKTEKEKPVPSRGPAGSFAGEQSGAMGGGTGPPLPQPPAEATTPEALRDWVIAESGLLAPSRGPAGTSAGEQPGAVGGGTGKLEGPLAKRFAEILESRLDGSRDAATLKEVLMRGAKVGGLGLDSLAADKVVQLAEAAAARAVREIDRVRETPTEVRKSESQKEVLAPKAPSPAPPLLAASHEAMVGAMKPAIEVRSQKSGFSASWRTPAPRSNDILRAERSEVEKLASQQVSYSSSGAQRSREVSESASQKDVTTSKIAEEADELEIATETQVLPAKVPMDAAGISAKLQDAIIAVLRLSGLTFPNLDIQKRFENTVSARLRDLRDATETTEMLTKAVTEGGVGLSSEQMKAILPILEEHVRALHAELQTEKKRELEEWKMQEAAKSIEKQQVKDSAEEASRDALLARITAKSKKARQTFAAQKQAPSPAVSAAAQAPRVPEEMTKVKRAAPPILPPQPVMRPKMQDVRFTPKLVGPVEELRGITLTDFRRLSKDPKEAAVKIRDKVDLLGQESYTQRIVAVTAWQEGEVYRLYLEVLRESLAAGKPPKEVIAGRGAAGKPTLTEPEFAAIMELSRTLRL
ncbi:MAG: hypothetical protein AAB562_04450 [Patescibacteria group bacterium]